MTTVLRRTEAEQRRKPGHQLLRADGWEDASQWQVIGAQRLATYDRIASRSAGVPAVNG